MRMKVHIYEASNAHAGMKCDPQGEPWRPRGIWEVKKWPQRCKKYCNLHGKLNIGCSVDDSSVNDPSVNDHSVNDPSVKDLPLRQGPLRQWSLLQHFMPLAVSSQTQLATCARFVHKMFKKHRPTRYEISVRKCTLKKHRPQRWIWKLKYSCARTPRGNAQKTPPITVDSKPVPETSTFNSKLHKLETGEISKCRNLKMQKSQNAEISKYRNLKMQKS